VRVKFRVQSKTVRFYTPHHYQAVEISYLNKLIVFCFLERLFDQQLENLLRSVVENGFPAFGIPPLDPIAGNISLGEINLPGVLK
jgi:hypothetical protein